MTVRAIALTTTMLAALSLAACGEDENQAANEAEQTASQQAAEAAQEAEDAADAAGAALDNASEQAGEALSDATQDAAEATADAAEEARAAAESLEQEMEVSGAETAVYEGAPALAALTGSWAETERGCGRREVTFTQRTVTLPKGECEIRSSDVDDGTLSMGVVCGGDAGEQQWTVEGAQDEASPQQVTLDRGEGEPIDLVRCS